MTAPEGEGSTIRRFKPLGRKSVRLASSEMVRTNAMDGLEPLPLVIEPNAEEIDLVSWADTHRKFIESQLWQYGAILFRNFGINSTSRFAQFIKATSAGALPYSERSSPRTALTDNIYTSTDHPHDQSIFLHNEQSYNLTFPGKIYFLCMTPAPVGGETPLADCRKIYRSIDSRIRERFMRDHYLYVRNFGSGFGLQWETAFQTTERSVVGEYCRQNDIQYEWKDANRLQTKQVRRVAIKHYRSGAESWFNHATFFNLSTLAPEQREKLATEFGDAVPNQTYYGDGSQIEASVLDELRERYLQEKVVFQWQQGDVLMIDNVLVAHGREPFEGPRLVVAGMADPYRHEKI